MAVSLPLMISACVQVSGNVSAMAVAGVADCRARGDEPAGRGAGMGMGGKMQGGGDIDGSVARTPLHCLPVVQVLLHLEDVLSRVHINDLLRVFGERVDEGSADGAEAPRVVREDGPALRLLLRGRHCVDELLCPPTRLAPGLETDHHKVALYISYL